MKKRIKILGVQVPVLLVAALVIGVVGALAWGLWLTNLTVEGQVASGATAEWNVASCAISQGGGDPDGIKGPVTHVSCTTDAQAGPDAVAGNLSPELQFYVAGSIINTSDEAICLAVFDTSGIPLGVTVPVVPVMTLAVAEEAEFAIRYLIDYDIAEGGTVDLSVPIEFDFVSEGNCLP